jgi:Tfp pilus assembly protein PilF
MSTIYRDLAKTTQARDSSRHSLELACSLGNDQLSCMVLKVRGYLDDGRTADAKDATNAFMDWLNHSGGQENGLHRDDMLVELAILWYQSNDLRTAEYIYRQTSEDLKRLESSSQHDSAVAAVQCNLAFIFVDEGSNSQAIESFRHGLAAQNSPDCEAGLAVALKQAHQDEAALAEYRVAKSHDPAYGPGGEATLRNSNFWSSTACALLRELIDMDSHDARVP